MSTFQDQSYRTIPPGATGIGEARINAFAWVPGGRNSSVLHPNFAMPEYDQKTLIRQGELVWTVEQTNRRAPQMQVTSALENIATTKYKARCVGLAEQAYIGGPKREIGILVRGHELILNKAGCDLHAFTLVAAEMRPTETGAFKDPETNRTLAVIVPYESNDRFSIRTDERDVMLVPNGETIEFVRRDGDINYDEISRLYGAQTYRQFGTTGNRFWQMTQTLGDELNYSHVNRGDKKTHLTQAAKRALAVHGTAIVQYGVEQYDATRDEMRQLIHTTLTTYLRDLADRSAALALAAAESLLWLNDTISKETVHVAKEPREAIGIVTHFCKQGGQPRVMLTFDSHYNQI